MKIPDNPISFGYKISWYAVKTSDNLAIKRLIKPNIRTMQCSWQEAMTNYYGFISPPINGWTLLIKKDFDQNLLEKLSKMFGEAQFFGSHRISDYYEYVKAIDGNIVRHVLANGFVEKNIGELSIIEMNCDFSTEAMYDVLYEQNKTYLLEQYEDFDEDFIIKMAAEWSVNPTTIDEIVEINPSYVCVFCE